MASIQNENDSVNIDNYHRHNRPSSSSSHYLNSGSNETAGYHRTVDVFVSELLKFNVLWESVLRAYAPLEALLLAVGLVGNLLALITLARSRKMCTPSFVYHRTLVAADLTFCCNFFFNLVIGWLTSESCRQLVYRYYIGAFVSGTVYPTVNNICGFLVHYSTVVIALDQFLAIWFATGYTRWNRRRVSRCITCLTLFLSLVVHSWWTYIEKPVVQHRTGENSSMYWAYEQPCSGTHVAYYWTKRPVVNRNLRDALAAKELYNSVARMAYPIVLLLLTLGVIAGLVRRQRKTTSRRGPAIQIEPASFRDPAPTATCLTAGPISEPAGHRYRLQSDVSTFSMDLRKPPSANRLSTSVINGIDGVAPPNTVVLNRNRCQRAVFVLMLAVLALAFLQMAASESKRLLQLLYPAEKLLRTKVADSNLPINDRLWYFRLVLYGHQTMRFVSNVATAVERSCVCLLYIIMNRLFRRELISLFRAGARFAFNGRCCCKRKPSSQNVREIIHGRRNSHNGELHSATV